MSSLQTIDQNSTQNVSKTFPTSSTSSPQGIHPAGATANRANQPLSNDSSLDMAPLENSPPPQNRTPVSEQSSTFWLWPLLRTSAFIYILVALSPLLVVILLFMRLLQFIRHDRGYYNATLLKLSIRSWISLGISMVGFFAFVVISGSNSKQTASAKKLVKHFSVLPSWLYGVMFVVGFVGFNIQIILCKIIPYQSTFGYDGFYIRDRVLEILDCLFFCLVESIVVEHIPSIKHHTILGLHTYKWIQVSLFVFIGYNVITLSTWVFVWVLEQLVPKTLGPSSNDTIIEHSLGGKYIVYCAHGLRNSINFILIALMLLLTWVLYFGSHLSDTPRTKKVVEIGTETCISVLVCSVLWLIKTCVLLSWEVTAVYDRLSSELIKGGNQLYFLGLICRHNYDIFRLIDELENEEVALDDKQAMEKKGKLSKEDLGKTQSSLDKNIPDINWAALLLSPTHIMLRLLDARMRSESDMKEEWPKQTTSSSDAEDGNIKKKKGRLSTKVKERVRKDLVMQDVNRTPTLHATQIVAQYLLSAREALSADTFTSTTHLEDKRRIIQEYCMKQLIDGENRETDAKHQSSKKDTRKRELKHTWDHLKTELFARNKNETEISDPVHQKTETKTSEIELTTQQKEEPTAHQNMESELSDKIKAWMERSRSICLFLANTLYSTKEVVDCLNSIISLLLIATTLIMWLLLTGFATIKVFVLIASPLLAATFIFGDTCKSFFQGIMFVYVVHPFHIGDLCYLDDKMMEVWMVGVWKTIFKEVGTRVEIIYTNTELSTRNIVNHKTGFDWNDSIELDVSSLDTNHIKQLEGRIKEHLNDPKQNFKSSHNRVKMLTTGGNLKLSICFQHNVQDLEATSTNFEHVKRKHELLSKLTFKLHVLLEETTQIYKNSGLPSLNQYVADKSTEHGQ